MPRINWWVNEMGSAKCLQAKGSAPCRAEIGSAQILMVHRRLYTAVMTRSTAESELTTARLRLRWLTEDDAAMLLTIWNDPDFIRHVGDRGIRTPTQARQAMREGILRLYADHGYGPYLVELLDNGPAMGICGLFKRDTLQFPDIGYSLLPGFRGHGYAFEAACAVLKHARDHLALPQLKAIVSPANHRSIRLLERLGLQAEGTLRMPGDDRDVALYGIVFDCATRV
jgi:ribosomal-protein-alanine N-acetyltransferase